MHLDFRSGGGGRANGYASSADDQLPQVALHVNTAHVLDPDFNLLFVDEPGIDKNTAGSDSVSGAVYCNDAVDNDEDSYNGWNQQYADDDAEKVIQWRRVTEEHLLFRRIVLNFRRCSGSDGSEGGTTMRAYRGSSGNLSKTVRTGDKVGIRADKFVAAGSALDGLTNEVWCKFVFLVAMRTFDVHDSAMWVKDLWTKYSNELHNIASLFLGCIAFYNFFPEKSRCHLHIGLN